MPLNLIKQYSSLLELVQLNEAQRRSSLLRIFKRDIEDNHSFLFRTKQIRPVKKEGQRPMEALFHHLTTKDDHDTNGKKIGSRSFEMERSIRLHWIKYHIEETRKQNIEIFSYEDRVDGVNRIRTYIYDVEQEYVIILEPQKARLDYNLITAYYLNEPGGKKQISKKSKKRLEEVY